MTKTEIATHPSHKITELKGLSLVKALLEFARTPLNFR